MPNQMMVLIGKGDENVGITISSSGWDSDGLFSCIFEYNNIICSTMVITMETDLNAISD